MNPPSRISNEGGDGVAAVGRVVAALDTMGIYSLCLVFRAREGMALPRWTRWVFGMTRRVLFLLAMLKMVFDVTRRVSPPPRHVVVPAKGGWLISTIR